MCDVGSAPFTRVLVRVAVRLPRPRCGRGFPFQARARGWTLQCPLRRCLVVVSRPRKPGLHFSHNIEAPGRHVHRVLQGELPFLESIEIWSAKDEDEAFAPRTHSSHVALMGPRCLIPLNPGHVLVVCKGWLCTIACAGRVCPTARSLHPGYLTAFCGKR